MKKFGCKRRIVCFNFIINTSFIYVAKTHSKSGFSCPLNYLWFIFFDELSILSIVKLKFIFFFIFDRKRTEPLLSLYYEGLFL